MPKIRRAIAKQHVNKIYKKWGRTFEGRNLFYFGGGGSGKSVDAIQYFCKRVVKEKGANHKILVIRKVAATLKESCYDLFKKEFQKLGYWKFCKTRYSGNDRDIVFTPNGNKIIFKGMDDPEKIKSINDVTSIFIEEVTELTEQDYNQLQLRLRGEFKFKKQIVACFNPVSEDHWLLAYVEPQLYRAMGKGDLEHVTNLETFEDGKVWQFEVHDDDPDTGDVEIIRTRVLNTNYKDNRFIDRTYIAFLNTLAAIDEVHYTVYKMGRWGRIIEGNPYAPQFKHSQHVIRGNKPNIGKPVHYTVDFNVDPYMSGLVIQLEYKEGEPWNGHNKWHRVRILKEYALKKDKATAWGLGNELVNDFQLNQPLQNGLILYGDASGHSRLGIKDTKNHFEDLKRGLDKMRYITEDRIPSSNPRYKRIAPKSLGRRAFLNLLLSGHLPVKIEIDPTCYELINDLKYCTTDTNGAKEKKKTKGIELRGHMLDALEYFLCHPESLGYLAVYS